MQQENDTMKNKTGEGLLAEAEGLKARLREANALLETIFDGTHVMVACMDRDFRFIRASRSFCAACGKTARELEGKSFFELHPGAEERRIFRRVVETGEAFSDEDRPFACLESSQEHEPMYADWSLHPVRDPDGKVQGVVLTLVDRTRRKKPRIEGLGLEKAVEQAGDGIIVTDPEGRALYANPAGKEISGMGLLEGKPLDFLGNDRGLLPDIRARLERDGRWEGRVEKTRDDGTKSEFDATVTPIIDDAGDILSCIVIEHDVTGKLKLERQVLRMQKMESLGRLTGGIAHDLNNILYPIIINAEMLMEDAGPGASMHRPLGRILTAAYRQRDLVKQIIAFSRRTEQQPKPVRAAPIVEEALKFLRSSLPSTIMIELQRRASSDLVMCDPAQIRQIVMNLCSNAADALDSRPGTITVTIDDIRSDADRTHPELKPGAYFEIVVEDTGQGMSREVMDRVFEPFFTTKGMKSSGMGLSVVHGIVESLRGTVRVESDPGKGSRFTVLLPLLGEAYRQRSDAVRRERSGDGKKRVLLVDDEAMVLGSVQRALERLGFFVTAVRDGVDALDAFRKTPDDFDLIITDQTMPRMTGAELAEEAMRIRPDIPVILCTGFSEVISEQEAKEMGIRDLIMKPATTKDLSDSIRRALNE